MAVVGKHVTIFAYCGLVGNPTTSLLKLFNFCSSSYLSQEVRPDLWSGDRFGAPQMVFLVGGP